MVLKLKVKVPMWEKKKTYIIYSSGKQNKILHFPSKSHHLSKATFKSKIQSELCHTGECLKTKVVLCLFANFVKYRFALVMLNNELHPY